MVSLFAAISESLLFAGILTGERFGAKEAEGIHFSFSCLAYLRDMIPGRGGESAGCIDLVVHGLLSYPAYTYIEPVQKDELDDYDQPEGATSCRGEGASGKRLYQPKSSE